MNLAALRVCSIIPRRRRPMRRRRPIAVALICTSRAASPRRPWSIAASPRHGRAMGGSPMCSAWRCWRRASARRRACAEALTFVLRSCALMPGEADFFANLAVAPEAHGRRPRGTARARPCARPRPRPPAGAIDAGGASRAASGDIAAALARVRKVIARTPGFASAYTTLRQPRQSGRQAGGSSGGAAARAVDLEPENARTLVQLGRGVDWRPATRPARRAPGNGRWSASPTTPTPSAISVCTSARTANSASPSGCIGRRRRPMRTTPKPGAIAASPRSTPVMSMTPLRRFREAIRLKPNYADARMALGMALIGRGEWAEGLAQYEWRLRSDRLGMGKDMPAPAALDRRGPARQVVPGAGRAGVWRRDPVRALLRGS